MSADHLATGASGWRPGLVTVDVDGTLVRWYDPVRPAVVAAVQRAVAAGCHVVVSTGRSLHGTVEVLAQLGLHSTFVICSNGAVLGRIDLNGFAEPVDITTFDAGPAVRRLVAEMPHLLVAVEDVGLGYRVNREFPAGELSGEITVGDIDSLVAVPVVRVILRDPAGDVGDFLSLVDRMGLHGVSYSVGYTAWLDLAPHGVTKASAAEEVRRRLRVDPSATLALGDGRNDVEMLQWAARGVAMADGQPEAIAAADGTTPSVTEDGVAIELDRWFSPGL